MENSKHSGGDASPINKNLGEFPASQGEFPASHVSFQGVVSYWSLTCQRCWAFNVFKFFPPNQDCSSKSRCCLGCGMYYLKIPQSSWLWLASWVGGYIQSIRITLAENEPIDQWLTEIRTKKLFELSPNYPVIWKILVLQIAPQIVGK